MKKEYFVWLKVNYHRGRWISKTIREIVEDLYSLENVDDLQGMVDDINELIGWAEYEKEDILEEVDSVVIEVNPGTYATIDYESKEECQAILNDLIDELKAHAEMIEEVLAEQEKEDE